MAHRRAPDLTDLNWWWWRTHEGLDVDYLDADNTGYLVRMVLVQRPAWHVKAVTFEPGPSGEAVDAAGVREFKFGAVVSGAIGLWFELRDPEEDDDHGASLLPSGRDLQKMHTQAERQSTMLTAVELYRRALARGSRKPTKETADALHRSPAYIAKLLSQARRQKLLGPAPSGKAGES